MFLIGETAPVAEFWMNWLPLTPVPPRFEKFLSDSEVRVKKVH